MDSGVQRMVLKGLPSRLMLTGHPKGMLSMVKRDLRASAEQLW